MAIWFRHGSSTVGVEDGIIRAADFAAFISLQQAADAVQADRLAMLSQAQTQADTCINDAQLEAEAMLNEAQQESELLVAQAQEQYNTAYEEGHAKGHEDATTEWMEGVLTNAHNNQRALQRQRERLSGIVSLAVEAMVEEQDKQAIFRRALRIVSKLVRDVPMLTLRVHLDDKQAAENAITDMRDQLQLQMPIEVVADVSSVQGSCTFESDQGVIDASLGTQLAALKRAVERAAKTASLFTDMDVDPEVNAVATAKLSRAIQEKASFKSAALLPSQDAAPQEPSASVKPLDDLAIETYELQESEDAQFVVDYVDDMSLDDSELLDSEAMDEMQGFGGMQSDTAIRLSNPS
jgi:type III secretion protein L